jgi:tetratricopeptide (TPR) repeat protein
VVAYPLEVSGDYYTLTALPQYKNRPTDLLASYGEILRIVETVLDKDPRNAQALKTKALTLRWRGDVLSGLGRHKEALRDWDRALPLTPADSRQQWPLDHARALARAGEPQQAVARAEEVIRRKAVSSFTRYQVACVHSLAVAALRKDTRLAPAERAKQIAHSTSRAVELIADLVVNTYLFAEPFNLNKLKTDRELEAVRMDAMFQKALAPVLELERGRARARAGGYAGAAAAADRLLADPALSPFLRYQAAGLYALARAAVLKDTKQAQTERDRLAEQYANRAVGLLTALQREGHFRKKVYPFHLYKLRNDHELDALRMRNDFQKLLADAGKE